jgi:hypothetical protein
MWIITAWQSISPEVIVKGFKCCISNAMDETDDMLWNGSEEDGDVGSECEKDKGTDCEDGDGDTDW